LGFGTELLVGGTCGAIFWLLLGWLFLNPKQLPIQPKKPPLGAAPAYVWVGAICAEAKPTITKVKAAIATNAITIFVLLIVHHHIMICAWKLMAVG
jgi:hypothetical protein